MEMGERCCVFIWIIVIFFSCVDKTSCIVKDVDVSASGPPAISEGSSVDFTCKAICTNGTCEFSWLQPNVKIQRSNSTHSIAGIANVNRSNAGTYECKVVDVGDRDEKTVSYILKVYYGPDSIIINDTTSKSVIEGSSYVTACRCQTCVPGCSEEWTFNGQKEGQKGILQFNNVSRTNRGQHSCKCTNDAVPEKTISVYLALNVQYPPDVDITWNKDTKTLRCTAAGNPETYTFSAWRHRVGYTVVRSGLSGVPGQNNVTTLTLDGAHPYMETGSYRCSVSNDIGDYTGTKLQTKEIPVIVPDGPVLLESQAQYNVSKGSNVTMAAIIYANPKVTSSSVSVRHSNGTISIKGSNVTLTFLTQVAVPFYYTNAQVKGIKVVVQIAEVKEEYFGDIIIEMQNGIGLNSTIITLNPQGPPDPPGNITYIPDVNSVTFKLKPGFYNGANQTFYVEYSTNRNASVWNSDTYVEAGFLKADTYFKDVTVHGLQPETAYYFRLKGVNMYGESEPTEILEIKTLEEPLNIAAIAGGATAGAVVVVILIVIVICILKPRVQVIGVQWDPPTYTASSIRYGQSGSGYPAAQSD